MNASVSTCLRVLNPARLLCLSQAFASLGSSSSFSLAALWSKPVLISKSEPITVVTDMPVLAMNGMHAPPPSDFPQHRPAPRAYVVHGNLLFSTQSSLIQKEEFHGHTQ